MIGAAQLLDAAQRAGEDELRDVVEGFLCEATLAEFVYAAWTLHHEQEPLMWAPHIDCICEHLEATVDEQIQWLIINVPPGFSKSLLCSVYFPSWVWLKRPWYKFLCLSTNDHVTLRDARRHREIVTSPWYRRVFRPDWGISKSQAADGNFGNTRHGERVSRTVRSSIVGARPHGRLLDDPNDPEKINPDEYTRTNRWIEHTLLKRRAKLTSPLILIQQRLHEADATGYLLSRARNPNTVHLVLPNRYKVERSFASTVVNQATGIAWRDWRTQDDELLFEPILDRETTEQEIAADGGVMDAAQNQQDPTPRAGIIFRRDMFRRWSHEPNLGDWPEGREPDFTAGDYPTHPLPDKFDLLVSTCDPNNLKDEKAKRHTDYAVIDIWGKHGLDYYLLAQVRQKLGVSATIAAVKDVIEHYSEQLACVLIESKANGPTVIAGVRAVCGLAAEEKLPRTHQFIRDWGVQGESKTQRAEGIAYVAEAGRVYIQDERENGELEYWLNEVCGFPGRTRDDRVDTMTMALTFLERDRQFG